MRAELLNLCVRVANTLEDCEFVRVLRNSSAKFWTNNQSQISAEEQRHWWDRRERNGYKLFIFDDYEMNVGYLLLRNQGENWGALTLAVVESMRSKGIGTFIYRWAIQNMKSIGFDGLVADIYKTNIASLVSAIKAGFLIDSIGPNGTVRLVAT